MMSAYLPTLIEPRSLSQPISYAALIVAAWIACMGVRLYFTMYGNWLALSPCG